MIDPIVSAAFSIYSNKGAYALLLGSGVSRAAGIPTGWEVVTDLIKKIATLEEKLCEPDPDTWFRKTHGIAPDYSKLLDQIAKTPAERQQLLRKYFEPSEEERKQNLKTPSSAHRAIADLVSDGFIRVIVTTNFDRLTELALEKKGVVANVISTPDQLAGSLPLAHAGVTVIKLHGDYLDTRIMNTEQELSKYADGVNAILDRILDEYGLVVSGWSADWDPALRSAIERCVSRRFTTYWTSRSPLSEKALRLVKNRNATVVQIDSADRFFESLASKVRALVDIEAPHPLSAKMAAATIKRYLVDPGARIRIGDLVFGETEKLVSAIKNKENFPDRASDDHAKELLAHLNRYESLTEILVSTLAAGSYWGDPEHVRLWTTAIERVANATTSSEGYLYLAKLRKYPALLLFFSAGVSALAAGKYQTLAKLFTGIKIRSDGKEMSAPLALYSENIVQIQFGQKYLPGMERHKTPFSAYLSAKLREWLREFLPSDAEYNYCFDQFEYLLALTCADHYRTEYQDSWAGPGGCFIWRGQEFDGRYAPKIVAAELEQQGENWPPLAAGMFGASKEQATTAVNKFNRSLGRHLY